MINFSIRLKLFIAIFLACSIAITAGLGFFRYQFKRTYLEFVREQELGHLKQLKTNLLNYYQRTGNWDQLRHDRLLWLRLQNQTARQLREEHRANGSAAVFNHARFLSSHDVRRRTVLLDTQRQFIQGHRSKKLSKPDIEHPIIAQAEPVAYLGLYKRRGFSHNSRDARFLRSQSNTILIIAAATLLGSLLVAWLLSQLLVKPVLRLRHGAAELADGNYSTRIPLNSRDELGQLSQDFNVLAERLQENEHSRRQWIMDIAHELRTPLAVLRGEIEAIQDGINQADPTTVHSLHQEVLHLQRLVDDLYALSMSDNGALSYQKVRLDFANLLQECVDQFTGLAHEQGLTVQLTQRPQQPLFIRGDPQRLQQLLQNLLNNSLRYTDSPGSIELSLASQDGQALLICRDTPPGVPDESLSKLFKRLYRVEQSRNRATGGAGIGLSICHNIVKAHQGKIQATHSPTGGLQITVWLPLDH